LANAGIKLERAALDHLYRFHELLRAANHDRDLTRIVGFENMVVKHYVDSMIVGQFVDLPSPLVDIGTGAGFPGIPLKIRYPKLSIFLAEPRPRRVAFLESVKKSLELRDVTVFPHRVVSKSFTAPVAGVITRALEPIEKTILRTSGCADVGTRYIFLKGPAVEPEVREAERRFAGELRLLEVRRYFLPGTPHERRLVVFERTKRSERDADDELDAGDAGVGTEEAD
jgi:16S rRNA (guanine527-N7)-methyltransferase